NGFEGDRPDEARRRLRHDGHDIVPALLEPAAHFDRLVGADAAGDSERDERHLRLVDLDDLAAQDFLLRDRNLLAALFARHGAGEQLPRTFAGEDDEFEAVFLRWSFHHSPCLADLTRSALPMTPDDPLRSL